MKQSWYPALVFDPRCRICWEIVLCRHPLRVWRTQWCPISRMCLSAKEYALTKMNGWERKRLEEGIFTRQFTDGASSRNWSKCPTGATNMMVWTIFKRKRLWAQTSGVSEWDKDANHRQNKAPMRDARKKTWLSPFDWKHRQEGS